MMIDRKSRDALDADSHKAAFSAVDGQSGDGGRPAGPMPSRPIVPPCLA